MTLVAGTGRGAMDPPEGVTVAPVRMVAGRVPSPGTLRPHLRRADVLVVHGGWSLDTLAAAREARSMGIPYVVTAHGVYYPQVFERRKVWLKHRWWTAFERPHLDRALAVHLFFAPEVDDLRRRSVASPVVLAPNGFDAPGSLRWSPAGEPYLLWLGRFDPHHKGLDLLLQAVRRLPNDERPRIRLVGVDWHGKRATVKDMVERLGVSRHVSLERPVYGEEKWKLLQESRGFVYPSRWDASPIAVLEAASIGVPLLLTRFHVASFLGERGAAFQVDPSPEGLADGLLRILEPGAEEVGRRAAQVVADELSWERVAVSWRDQVGALLEGERRRPMVDGR